MSIGKHKGSWTRGRLSWVVGVIAWFALLVAGCAQPEAAQTDPSRVTDVRATVVAETMVTAEAVGTAIPSPTPMPTATAVSTATPSPTPTVTPEENALILAKDWAESNPDLFRQAVEAQEREYKRLELAKQYSISGAYYEVEKTSVEWAFDIHIPDPATRLDDDVFKVTAKLNCTVVINVMNGYATQEYCRTKYYDLLIDVGRQSVSWITEDGDTDAFMPITPPTSAPIMEGVSPKYAEFGARELAPAFEALFEQEAFDLSLYDSGSVTYVTVDPVSIEFQMVSATTRELSDAERFSTDAALSNFEVFEEVVREVIIDSEIVALEIFDVGDSAMAALARSEYARIKFTKELVVFLRGNYQVEILSTYSEEEGPSVSMKDIAQAIDAAIVDALE